MKRNRFSAWSLGLSRDRVRETKRTPRLCALLVTTAVALGVLGSSGVARAQVGYDVLHAFTGFPDAYQPEAGLIQATDGNFYGTTEFGGSTADAGTVFRMTPDGTVTTLHAFTGFPNDGAQPEAGLVQASDGNFYGTTLIGGSGDFGTVFRMTPDGTVTILHAFTGFPNDGALPEAAPIQATDGNFYGTTAQGGGSGCGGLGCGTVFQMTADGTVTILYTFTGGADGAQPNAALIQASDGNFYGTTFRGGSGDFGTVFRMTPDGTVTILHAFTGAADGANPLAALIQASDGNFYGTTARGGSPANGGTVFKMIPDGTVTILHAFAGGTDGAVPTAALTQASDGNFYGTTEQGGSVANAGTVFRITLSAIPF